MTILIDAKTAATISPTFTFTSKEVRESTLFVVGLSTGETIPLEFTVDNGTTWTGVKCNTATVALTPTNNVMPLNVVGRYRLNKDITANPVTVVLQTSVEA